MDAQWGPHLRCASGAAPRGARGPPPEEIVVQFRELYLQQLAERLTGLVAATVDGLRPGDPEVATAVAEAGGAVFAALAERPASERHASGVSVGLLAARAAADRLAAVLPYAREVPGHDVLALAELEALVGTVGRALARTDRATTPPTGFPAVRTQTGPLGLRFGRPNRVD